MGVLPMSVISNLENLESRICAACARAHRSRDEIVLVGVSKKQPVPLMEEAYGEAGIRDFGENYVQEYLEKRELLRDMPEARWHFIGHLQRNKVRQLMSFAPDMIHSVDSPQLAVLLDRAAAEVHPGVCQKILVELRLGDEDTAKTGLLPERLPEMAATLDGCRHLRWAGLMLIAPLGSDSEMARPYFRRVREIFEAINLNRAEKLSVLSYGMSGDFEIAIEEGATHIRVGTALFGARQASAWH